MRDRLKRIHVNRHVLRRNHASPTPEPPWRIKVGRANIAAHIVQILGDSVGVYRPEKPLPCGAHCWVETRAPVLADGVRIE